MAVVLDARRLRQSRKSGFDFCPAWRDGVIQQTIGKNPG
jgi:hypothetical protein